METSASKLCGGTLKLISIPDEVEWIEYRKSASNHNLSVVVEEERPISIDPTASTLSEGYYIQQARIL